MRKFLLLCPALLAGCATAEAQPADLPVVGQGPSVCRQRDYGEFKGRTATSAVGAELQRASGARVIRWVPPGMMVTMDYREDRMTVRLDGANRIVSASCG